MQDEHPSSRPTRRPGYRVASGRSLGRVVRPDLFNVVRCPPARWPGSSEARKQCVLKEIR